MLLQYPFLIMMLWCMVMFCRVFIKIVFKSCKMHICNFLLLLRGKREREHGTSYLHIYEWQKMIDKYAFYVFVHKILITKMPIHYKKITVAVAVHFYSPDAFQSSFSQLQCRAAKTNSFPRLNGQFLQNLSKNGL